MPVRNYFKYQLKFIIIHKNLGGVKNNYNLGRNNENGRAGIILKKDKAIAGNWVWKMVNVLI